MLSLQKLCTTSFLEHVHPCLLKKAQSITEDVDGIQSDALQYTRTVARILELSELAKTLHPCLLPDVEMGTTVPIPQFYFWKGQLSQRNATRTTKPNAIGRVAIPGCIPFAFKPFVDDDRLTAEENAAKVSGRLCGIVNYTKVNNHHWHLRMDSFVHPGVWFEFQYNARSKQILSTYDATTCCYFLQGRLSAHGASSLRVRTMSGNLRFRIDDVDNREVWAEGDLPQYSKKRSR